MSRSYAQLPEGTVERYVKRSASGSLAPTPPSTRVRRRGRAQGAQSSGSTPPERERQQRPREVTEKLDLRGGAAVADMGAGTGYFALRVAAACSQVGVVAADAQQAMADPLGTQATARGLTNLAPVVVHSARAELSVKADLALLVDTFHRIADRTRYFSYLKGRMAPGSRTAAIDYARGAPERPRISTVALKRILLMTLSKVCAGGGPEVLAQPVLYDL